MVCDSYTPTWQNQLFEVYKMNPVQMMCGTNFFSSLLTVTTLVQQGSLYTSLIFMSQFPKFAFDCVLLSVCSAVGQLFIYSTVKEFGAITFAMIMTIRQGIAAVR